MARKPGDRAAREGLEPRLDWLVAEYVDRLNEGEAVDKQEILAAHPDLGSELIEQLEAFAEVAGGLHHAHARKIIHRDIKPSNLMLDGEESEPDRPEPPGLGGWTGRTPRKAPARGGPFHGRLQILDFGLARLEG